MWADIKKMVSVMRTVNASTTQALLTERKNAELELGGPRGPKMGVISRRAATTTLQIYIGGTLEH